MTPRADFTYAGWVGQMIRGARRRFRDRSLAAPKRALWAGLSRGLLEASHFPAWTRLWLPIRAIDADREDDFYRAGRLWGQLLGTCFRDRARSGRPLGGAEAEALVEAFSRYAAELALPRRGRAPLIDAVEAVDARTAAGAAQLDEVHAAGLEAVRRRGPEPDAETQVTMRRWLESKALD